MVRPEKWNHPEYDGLYIYRDVQGGLHLVAWNASEATTHSGKVSKLVALLLSLSMRDDEDAIDFQSVRFLFIVPNQHVNDFSLPSGSDALLAKQQFRKKQWNFPGFEVWGARCSHGE